MYLAHWSNSNSNTMKSNINYNCKEYDIQKWENWKRQISEGLWFRLIPDFFSFLFLSCLHIIITAMHNLYTLNLVSNCEEYFTLKTKRYQNWKSTQKNLGWQGFIWQISPPPPPKLEFSPPPRFQTKFISTCNNISATSLLGHQKQP